MISLLWIIFLFSSLLTIFYLRPNLIVGSIIFGVILTLVSAISSLSIIFKIIFWAVFLTCFILLNLIHLRQELISRRLLSFVKKNIPPMSETERAAIEAGDIWWEAEVFQGSPNWKKLLDFKKPELTKEEQEFIDGPVDELCSMIDNWEDSHKRLDLSPEVWKLLTDKKFSAFIIPKEYGGLGFSAVAQSEIFAKIAAVSVTASVSASVPNSLGPGELLLKYGTDEQKKYYLPRLASGEERPCFALTSPHAGSDASSIIDNGIVCKGVFEGKEIIGIKLNFDKRYITLAPIATLIGLAFKLYDPDNLLGKNIAEYGITCALLKRDTPGIEIGRRHFPLNTPFQNGPIVGKDVFIPLDWIIGGVDMAGKGWRMLMDCLSIGRAISLPAAAGGGANFATFVTGAYARLRKQFHTSIGNFDGIKSALAQMGGWNYLLHATRIMTAASIDQKIKPAIASAITKYHLTETGRKISILAMDIHGGKGICLGPKNYLGRGYQASPISITVEGANILTRCLIIFGQGAIRCHPYIMKEMEAASADDLGKLDTYLFSHVGYFLQNMSKSFILNITGGIFNSGPVKNYSNRYFKDVNRLSASFAFLSDFTMMYYGGLLKRKENISARLGDALSYLYMASMVLKRFNDLAPEEQNEEQVFLDWACKYALYKTESALFSTLQNYQSKIVANLLKVICFPFGRKYRHPSDELGNKVAELLIKDTKIKDRFLRNHYISNKNGKNQLAIMLELLKDADKFDEIEHIIRKAEHENMISGITYTDIINDAVKNNIIEKSQGKELIEYLAKKQEIIDVDSFSNEELHPLS